MVVARVPGLAGQLQVGPLNVFDLAHQQVIIFDLKERFVVQDFITGLELVGRVGVPDSTPGIKPLRRRTLRSGRLRPLTTPQTIAAPFFEANTTLRKRLAQKLRPNRIPRISLL